MRKTADPMAARSFARSVSCLSGTTSRFNLRERVSTLIRRLADDDGVVFRSGDAFVFGPKFAASVRHIVLSI